MRFYEYDRAGVPTMLLVPGTCCHHSMFDHVLDLLAPHFRVIVVSYDGFDETEPDAIYPDMTRETERIEAYVRDALGGTISCAYGSSLGGSIVAYLVQRQAIHIDHAIIGSSDMDEAGPFAAHVQAKVVGALLARIVREGLPAWATRRTQRRAAKSPESAVYFEQLPRLLTESPLKDFVSRESIENQYYFDLVTRIDDAIDVPGTRIHVFFALKMGESYRSRYLRHFAHPDIREHDLNHEELLVCHPEEWVREVRRCCETAGEGTQGSA